MFSIMTMASSTTKPVEMVSAIMVRLLRLKPHRYITPNVPTNESGTEKLGMSVAGRLRRNTKITATTSTTARNNSNSTSSTEARTVTVRSVSSEMSTDAGIDSSSCGSCRLIESTTPMTFAPGWRWMFMMMPGVVLAHAPSLLFSAPSTIVATSDKCTGAPFLNAMTMSRYASADLS